MKLLSLLFTLHMLDYVITYAGVHSGFVSEYNPVMVQFMERPFVEGFILRFLLGIMLYGTILLCQWISTTKKQKLIIDRSKYVALGIQITVFYIHFVWMFEMYKFLQ